MNPIWEELTDTIRDCYSIIANVLTYSVFLVPLVIIILTILTIILFAIIGIIILGMLVF